MPTSNEVRVSVDIGYRQHSVAIGLSDGQLVDEFDIQHDLGGFNQFFHHIESVQSRHGGRVSVAMEGFNGFAQRRHEFRNWKD